MFEAMLNDQEVYYDPETDYLYLKDETGGLVGAPLSTWEVNAESLRTPSDIARYSNGIKLITAQERWDMLRAEREQGKKQPCSP